MWGLIPDQPEQRNAVVINAPLKLDVSTTLGGTGSGLVVISNLIVGHGIR